MRYATRVNGLTDLAVTKLDVLDTLDRLGVCTGYEIGGELHEEFPGDLAQLDCVDAEVRVVRGLEALDGGRRARSSDLPAEARRYLDRIEALVEAPITYVSVGTRRDQIIGL